MNNQYVGTWAAGQQKQNNGYGSSELPSTGTHTRSEAPGDRRIDMTLGDIMEMRQRSIYRMEGGRCKANEFLLPQQKRYLHPPLYHAYGHVSLNALRKHPKFHSRSKAGCPVSRILPIYAGLIEELVKYPVSRVGIQAVEVISVNSPEIGQEEVIHDHADEIQPFHQDYSVWPGSWLATLLPAESSPYQIVRTADTATAVSSGKQISGFNGLVI